jgi:hypothetical protein
MTDTSAKTDSKTATKTAPVVAISKSNSKTNSFNLSNLSIGKLNSTKEGSTARSLAVYIAIDDDDILRDAGWSESCLVKYAQTRILFEVVRALLDSSIINSKTELRPKMLARTLTEAASVHASETEVKEWCSILAEEEYFKRDNERMNKIIYFAQPGKFKE